MELGTGKLLQVPGDLKGPTLSIDQQSVCVCVCVHARTRGHACPAHESASESMCISGGVARGENARVW